MDWKGDVNEQENGQVEVDRRRTVWEFLARPSMEYAAEVWWTENVVNVESWTCHR